MFQFTANLNQWIETTTNATQYCLNNIKYTYVIYLSLVIITFKLNVSVGGTPSYWTETQFYFNNAYTDTGNDYTTLFISTFFSTYSFIIHLPVINSMSGIRFYDTSLNPIKKGKKKTNSTKHISIACMSDFIYLLITKVTLQYIRSQTSFIYV